MKPKTTFETARDERAKDLWNQFCEHEGPELAHKVNFGFQRGAKWCSEFILESPELKALIEAAEKILERIDVNKSKGDLSGIGEYKGGPSFVVKALRESLSNFQAKFGSPTEGE